MTSALDARRRRGLRMALFAYAIAILAALAVESATGQRESAALTAALLLHGGFALFVLLQRPAALALLMMAMPLEPMLRTWAGTRFLTFAYAALLLTLFDLRAALRRLLPLDGGFWLLAVVVMWMFVSLLWTPTRWDGLVYTLGILGLLIGYCMPRALFAGREDLDHALRALVIGAVASLLLHIAVLPEAREGRLGAHKAMSGQDVSANFAVALMSALYLARNYRPRRFLLGAAAMLGVGIAMSFVRSTAFALLIGSAAFLALSSSGARRWIRVVTMLVFIGAAYGAAYLHNQPAAEPRFERTIRPESADRFLTGRVSIWTVALAMMREHPLAGLGAGSFPEEFDRYYRLTPATHGYGRNPDTHSIPLRNAAEAGVPAALLYLGFLAYSLQRAWRARHEPAGIGALAVGLSLCCVLITTVGAVYQPVLWMGTGLGIWVVRNAKAEARVVSALPFRGEPSTGSARS